jgi:hypothetical protein
MSHRLFNDVTVEQQETVVGGLKVRSLDGIIEELVKSKLREVKILFDKHGDLGNLYNLK